MLKQKHQSVEGDAVSEKKERKQLDNCANCIFSEGIDGTNRLGCQYDMEQHDMDDWCANHMGHSEAVNVMLQIFNLHSLV